MLIICNDIIAVELSIHTPLAIILTIIHDK